MELVLKVPYKDKPMMVGKVFTWQGETIFYHEHSSSQYFRAIPSLAVDFIVIEFLKEHGIRRIDYFDKEAGILRTADVEKISLKGIRLTLDSRDRFFIPISEWKTIDKTYQVPWITMETVLNAR